MGNIAKFFDGCENYRRGARHYDSPHAQEMVLAKLGGSVMAPQSDTYRGYAIGVERRSNIWIIFASPKTPDLPILACYCSQATAQTEIDALAEAKCRVDKVLAY